MNQNVMILAYCSKKMNFSKIAEKDLNLIISVDYRTESVHGCRIMKIEFKDHNSAARIVCGSY